MDAELVGQAAFHDWASGWFATTSGWFSVFFIGVIVFAVVALVRDWRQDRREFGSALHDDHGEPPESRINHGRY